MKFLSQIKHDVYCDEFWRRQKRNGSPCPGKPTYEKLKELYPYKLPNESNKSLWIVELASSEEIFNLNIHSYMLSNEWMTERNLVQGSTKLMHLAQKAIETGYFDAGYDKDGQVKNYHRWKGRKSLAGILDGEEKPLSELVGDSYEIVDGWGRLLRIATLLLQGVEFAPIKAFLAIP